MAGVFDINVKSIFHSVNVILPHFLSQGSGNVVNIASCITCKPTNGLMWYSATKAAVEVITRSLAREYSSKGIRVNAVSPSISETPLMREFIGEEPTAEALSVAAMEVPVGRLCTPLDIAKGALYFASSYFNDFQT
jgi:3-oxoacyl-[acyl-carrier protein] reductase